MTWHTKAKKPKKPGVYLILCPSADPSSPHIGMAWYEPPGTGNLTGWQLFDTIARAWGGVKAMSHWADWRPGLPSRAAQLRAVGA